MARRKEPTKDPTNESTTPTGTATTDEHEDGLNLVVLWGVCSAGVEVRTLDSGSRLASLGVRTPATAPAAGSGSRARDGANTSATSVPVTVWNPPAWLEGIDPREPLVVVGTVRRRFFATRGGGRGAKAEVEAVSIARATPAQRERAWQRAAGVLEALM